MDLTIAGKRCKIHHNHHIARSLEKGSNLIELRHASNNSFSHGVWRGDGNDDSHQSSNNTTTNSDQMMQVERHDVRTLLDEMALDQLIDNNHDDGTMNIDDGVYSTGQHQSSLNDESGSDNEKEEVVRNAQRYAGLEEYKAYTQNDEPKKHAVKCKETSASSDLARDDKSNEQIDEGKPFQLTDEQLNGLPPDITLPKTMRHNTIIEHTASRIALNNQLEVFLKVKQADNADFSFLNPSDDLYRYFQCLKEKYSNINSKASTKNKEESDGSEHGKCDNPLSGLLGGYASSSDDSDAAEEKAQGDKDVQPIKVKTELVDKNGGKEGISDEEDRKRNADRLERLRIWKETRLKK